MKKSYLVFTFVAGWLWMLAFSAFAFTMMDDKFSMYGYIQNMSSYRVGESSQLVGSENRLQLDMELEMHPDIIVFGSFRGMYDAVYDMRSDSSRWDKYAGSRGALSHETKMREIYLDLTYGSWDFRIGKQQVVWGETDGLRLMDIINPLDMRRQYITRDWEDIRRPLMTVKAVYGIDPLSNSFLELVWIPGDHKKDRIDLWTPNDKRSQSPWALSTPKLNFIDNPLVGFYPEVTTIPVIPGLGSDEEKAFNVRNSEFGVRLGGEIEDWFFTLNYFHGFSDAATYKFKGANLVTIDPETGDLVPWESPADPAPAGLLLDLEARYYRQNVVGLTFNRASGLWVWRGEFATYIDERFTDTERNSDMVVKKTRQHSMVGFDYKRWINCLNPEKMFFLSGQLFNFHVFDHDRAMTFGPYGQKLHEDTFYLTFLINSGWHMDRICPEILVVYDTTATGWYIKSKLEFKYGDHWRPEIGALVFAGDKYELPFGDFDNKDEIYFRLKYQF